ncbi:hypothetical protein BCR36DRAFT_413947 [Piromyces finnis]|uniref:Uncharacterized protein n=1 Tax=Piromyces finnis TaxID=1754191 RepID=A0A1Y1V3T9_9FUNG|nr:hypothetical protein BCR36DRAFT_413947 [Piromyces finnis]|eukprot:ORX46644.1 hypothetical protein BCR36DRAFT_413947 [Piromyces finnis]
MKIKQQNQKRKMLTNKINKTMERSINDISSNISKMISTQNNIDEALTNKKIFNGPNIVKIRIKKNISSFPNSNKNANIVSEGDSISSLNENVNISKKAFNNNNQSNENKLTQGLDEALIKNNDSFLNNNNNNNNGNLDNLFDSDSSLSSVSFYESDYIIENETFSKEEINYEKNMEIQKNESISETENDTYTEIDSLESTEKLEDISYFDDSSSITSLSSLISDSYFSSSNIITSKPKRKLKKIKKEITKENDSNTIESEIIPKRKRRKRSTISSVSSSHLSINISTPENLDPITVPIPKRRGRKPKNMKTSYNYNQLIKINSDINNMWNTLHENLKEKNQKNFEIPDSIVNEFEGLIKNPNNGDYINSYEWNIMKMSNDGKFTSFLTSDTFIPKTSKCLICQETIEEEDKKCYCEYCKSYYHQKCIKDDTKEPSEIVQIDKPVDIFRKAYNLNLSNNHLIHNVEFKWFLQKKWICPNHKDKNPIPKPKLKYPINTQDKKIKSNISSPNLHQNDSSVQSSTKKSSQKKKKDNSKMNHLTTSHSKKRSRDYNTTSAISNTKQENNSKRKESVVLKFITNNEPFSHDNPSKNSSIEIKKKNMKFNPDVDPDIYIHLKNEESLSTNIINKVIPKESSKFLKPEVRFKATEEQIKLDFIKKVNKSSKEIEDWLNSLILFHQDIIQQLYHKNLISTVPPTPSINSSSTYLIDTLCSAIEYSKKEDDYTKSLFETDKKNEEKTFDNKEKDNQLITNASITSDEIIPDIITKDSLIYQQYCYWKYICRSVINE